MVWDKLFPHFNDQSHVFHKDHDNWKGVMSAIDILEELN